MRRPALLALALAAALLPVTPPAAAQADRAAARAFIDATVRFEEAVRAQGPAVRARFDVLLGPGCVQAVQDAPRRQRARADAILTAALVDAVFRPTHGAIAAFVADLNRVRTDDRALRGGRAAWRALLREVRGLPPVPEDLCAQLERWRASGYARDAAPRVRTRPFTRLGANRRVDRQLARAVARLQQLGISRRAARRFTGERVFADLIDDLLARVEGRGPA